MRGDAQCVPATDVVEDGKPLGRVAALSKGEIQPGFSGKNHARERLPLPTFAQDIGFQRFFGNGKIGDRGSVVNQGGLEERGNLLGKPAVFQGRMKTIMRCGDQLTVGADIDRRIPGLDRQHQRRIAGDGSGG